MEVTKAAAAAHLRGGRLFLSSFSVGEAEYLSKHLGSRKNPPAFKGEGCKDSIAFAMAWSAVLMTEDAVKDAKEYLAGVARLAPVAKSEPEPEPEPKAFDVADLPVSEKAQDALRDAGLLTPEDILSEGTDGLIALPSIGKVAAKKILDALGG